MADVNSVLWIHRSCSGFFHLKSCVSTFATSLHMLSAAMYQHDVYFSSLRAIAAALLIITLPSRSLPSCANKESTKSTTSKPNGRNSSISTQVHHTATLFVKALLRALRCSMSNKNFSGITGVASVSQWPPQVLDVWKNSSTNFFHSTIYARV